MAAKRVPRMQLRAKPLIVDPDTQIDLAAYELPIDIGGAGRMLLLELNANTPYWLDAADLPMVGMLAVATDAVADAMNDPDATPAARAAVLKEWRQYADALGLTPAARSRLRLTEAQAVTAARRAEALRNHGNTEPDREPIPVDKLLGD